MSTSPPESVTPVAIIGAGLSGLATAVRLRELGVHSIIYEAQSYPGGRVRTIQTSRGALDLGATWFHGTVANAALDVAITSGNLPPPPSPLPEHSSDKIDEYGTLVFSTPGVHVLPTGEVCVLEVCTMDRIIRQYADQLHALSEYSGVDVAVEEVMRKATGYASMNALERGIFHARDSLESVVNGCNGCTKRLSALRIGEYEVLPGDNQSPGESGMVVVVDALLEKLEKRQLVLNKEVVSVCWGGGSEPEGATIRFREGVETRARYVVWTPSLNVTKRAVFDGVFDPALPKEKIEALMGREQGVVEKVFVLIEQPLEGIIAHQEIPVVWELEADDVREWEHGVYGMIYDDRALTVGFWLSGEAGVKFGELGNGMKIREVRALLTRLLRQEVRVVEVVNSCWSGNRFVRGSYSYPCVGGGGCEDLAAPLPNEEFGVLGFAGEATHNRYYSTMHGAIESGYREAERCCRLMGK